MISAELWSIIAPASVAGLMIALTHAPLGIEVLKRGIIFIDLAVAQIAGLGLVATGTLIHDAPAWLMQLIALLCAATAGLFFRLVEQRAPKQQEAIIGVCFVLSASLAILLLAGHPYGGEEIQHLLSGQMLFVTWQDVLRHAPVYGLILALWFAVPPVRRNICFYLLFALAVTSSVQLVGVYVVFASLILPALAALHSSHPHMKAWCCGIISVLCGVICATLWDVPAGPVTVISYTIVTIVSVIISKIKG